ncbi:hypothetical protein MXAN_6590 [Myxococcus xanthus DK 1622]|uniref:Uncharacterized protein n=1 Tax=Myxococcus xanthus (strain DK1622) TaxID=246197 RepID=Q1CY12_MYXXD|nr:hypothetical protein MXAN_6590 [Myxococcus xanthus DK 1622]
MRWFPILDAGVAEVVAGGGRAGIISLMTDA